MLYRRFYKHSSSATMQQLYLSYIRPQLEYAAPVWDPHHTTLIYALERVQKFALKICSKTWNSTHYESLCSLCNLPTLSTRRLYLKLCFLYQIVNERFKLPDISLRRRNMLPHLRNSDRDSILYERPAVSTEAYKFSFLPHTISSWNALPPDIQNSSSLYSFKHYLLLYLTSF